MTLTAFLGQLVVFTLETNYLRDNPFSKSDNYPTPRPCLRRIILLQCENGNFEKNYKSFKEDQFKLALTLTLSPTQASFSLVFHLGSIAFPF